MREQIDLRVAELLCSRLCHDLISPIGAVSNGIELLEEEGGRIAVDALELAGRSARQAARLLQFFRIAFGLGGSFAGGRSSEVRDLAHGLLAGGRHALDWRETGEAAATLPAGFGKLALNMVLLAMDSLPRGGTIAVAVDGQADRVSVVVTASGGELRFSEEHRQALGSETAPDALTPRTVQAYFTALLARRLGSELAVTPLGEEPVRFTVVAPQP
jgi:histidine phosphotransferase ChpT